MTSEEFDSDNSTEIVSVSDYIQKIEELIESSKGGSANLYFRGQEDSKWDIEPSIFRNDMLSIEHKLMQVPLQKIPSEFINLNTKFDIMTKYQHYGMCTRLLDLTANPLVALYFACKMHNKTPDDSNSENNSKEPDGVVFLTNKFYSLPSTSLEVNIIAELANYDLSKENKLSEVLEKLQYRGVIMENDKERWLTKRHYEEFVDIIQDNYVIVPPYTNERLIRQSGAFLLSSMFSITVTPNINDIIITKTRGSLKDYFLDKYFYVNGENKENIMKELDLYNINEATLFPELEHQLNYIYKSSQHLTKEVSYFTKYDSSSKTEIEKKNTKEPSTVIQQLESINLDIDAKIIDEVIDKTLNETVVQDHERTDLKKIIKQYTKIVDWYKRIPTLNGIKMAIKKYYVTIIHENDLEEKINDIIYKLLINLYNICKKND